MMKHLIFFTGLTLAFGVGHAQDTVTLAEVIGKAQSGSPQYKLYHTQREVSYYVYQLFKSDLKPQISFYGNAPVYSKQYGAITQPDGTIYYLPVKQNTASAGFSLSQKIRATGGDISLNTSLSRYDDLQGGTYQYNGTPVFLQFNQPLFGFNALKWSSKIEPLKLEESKRTFVQSMESMAQQFTGLYFNVISAQENIRISGINFSNTKDNYEVEKQRVSLGTTTEDKLLQLQLQLLTNQQNLEKSRYDYQVALLALNSALGSKDSAGLTFVLPEAVPDFDIDLNKALESAKKYRPEFLAFERKRLEAAGNVDNARAAKQQVNVSATFGLNHAGTDLGKVYTSGRDQQTLSVGFNIPIIDWGRRSASYNAAKASLKLTIYNNEIDEVNYIQEIVTIIKNIPLVRNNISLTQVRDTVAQKRYLIANALYKVGKLSISDLNIAQNEKDNARQEYVSALRSFWETFYLLRRTTLYDFQRNKELYNSGTR